MSFIVSFGVGIPQFQIEDKVLDPAAGSSKAKRCIAYTDEDIITLGYAAATNCLKNQQSPVDAILFASTSPVFKGRYHASFLGDQLGLNKGILALDLMSSVRSGTDALILADQLLQGKQYKQILIVASELYFPPIGKELSKPFGHSAVALLIGKSGGLARIGSTHSYSSNIAGTFSYKGSEVILDSRFSSLSGIKSDLTHSLKGIDAQKYASVIVPQSKQSVGVLKKCGFNPMQLFRDQLVVQTGFTGATHALLLLVDGIERAKGNILLLDHSNGTNLISIEDLQKPRTVQLKKALAGKTPITSYQDYLKIRKCSKFTSPNYRPTEMFSSEMMQEREKDQLLYLKGFKCNDCGTLYYMKAARCKKCQGTSFESRTLSRAGSIYSITREHFFPNSFPPITMAVIDLKGGGRITLQQTDDMYKNRALEIGDKVELVLRKMSEQDAKPNYFWKCVAL